MSLRENALRSYHDERARAEERRREQLQSFAQAAGEKFSRLFEAEPDAVEPDFSTGEVQLTCEGLRFVAWEDGRWVVFHLLGACPQCGQEVRSRPIADRYALGEMLTAFRPDFGHHCPEPAQPEPTPQPDQALGAALAFVQAMNAAVHHNGDGEPLT